MAIPSPLAVEVCARDDDVTLLGRTLFVEGRGEPWWGKVGIAFVVTNRRDTAGRWPRSIRGVVLQRFQFSGFGDGPHLQAGLDPEATGPADQRAWGECLRAASAVLCDRVPDPTKGANHYLTDALFRSAKCPAWAKGVSESRIVKLGRHRFLRL